MKIIHFKRGSKIEEIYEALHAGAIVIHLNNVYAVVALANSFGIASLDKIKSRKPHKCYGTLVSDTERFLKESDLDENTITSLKSIIKTGALEGCFLRLNVTCLKGSGLTVNGTHQGLILEEPTRSFCSKIERMFKGKGEFTERLLCSSANISGDPSGAIIDRKEALKFGVDRGAEVFVEFDFPYLYVEKGSFPIVSISNMVYKIERVGPGMKEIETELLEKGFSKIV